MFDVLTNSIVTKWPVLQLPALPEYVRIRMETQFVRLVGPAFLKWPACQKPQKEVEVQFEVAQTQQPIVWVRINQFFLRIYMSGANTLEQSV